MDTKILNFFSRNSRRSFRRREIADHLRFSGNDRKLLTKTLACLVRDGALQERRGSYRLVQRRNLLEGTISLHEQGYGFFSATDNKVKDLFVPAKHINKAIHGDRIRVSRVHSRRDNRPYGRVVEIVSRAVETFLGIYREEQEHGWVSPLDPRLPQVVFVRPGKENGAQNGQIVELRFSTYPADGSAATGDVENILGAEGDPQVDIEVVIQNQNLPHQFTAVVLREAEAVAVPVMTETGESRVDLRHLPLVTIDGESAQDFDDAVALQAAGEGQYRLWVCVADVAHYVAADGAIDLAAKERGTSVYFPGYSIPMLPESLSSGICSLKPAEDRLVMTAEILFDEAGQMLNVEIYPAIICSQARLTYDQVAAVLKDPNSRELDASLKKQLRQMVTLADSLYNQRQKRGSLELDLSEREIILDEKGCPVAVQKVERNAAHRLIEEFMLAANEAVADFLQKQQYLFLYRVHEQPRLEDLQDLQQLLADVGIGMSLTGNLHQMLQKLLAEVVSRPEAPLVRQQLLRSLQQAQYSPVNKGHFGLAADCYCHFTSPIRRYPDLIVHRVLKLALANKKPAAGLGFTELQKRGSECSSLERRAMAAERELFDLRCCQVMEQHRGRECWGVITSVADFGFFVVLDAELVEGLVHVRSLHDDYYDFDPVRHRLVGERRRQSFRVGNRVLVSVAEVDIRRRRLDFTLVERAT